MRRLLVLVLLGPLLWQLLWLSACAPAAAASGSYGWPLSGTPEVERPFTPPTTAYGRGHRGVDLRAAVGQPVLAAGPGRVSYAGLLAGRGVVTVTHAGGLRTTYEPVTASVRVGAVVVRGQRLGTLSTGHASCRVGRSCLHWGLLRGRAYLDPLSLIGQGPIRLLPVGDPTRLLRGLPDAAPALARAAVPPVQHPRAARSAAPATAPAAAQPAAQGGLRGPARGIGAVAAAGSLLAGIGLLAGRRQRPAPPPPSAPAGAVDLTA